MESDGTKLIFRNDECKEEKRHCLESPLSLSNFEVLNSHRAQKVFTLLFSNSLGQLSTCMLYDLLIFNNYSPKWRWLAVDIY